MGRVTFTKVVGSGNDFVILDNRQGRLNKDIGDFSDFAKEVCVRRNSIGADGLLVLEDSDKADFRMRIINPDGSEVTMCGNGARCSALYAYKNDWCSARLKMETGAGILEAEIVGDNVKLKMTNPHSIRLDNDIGLGSTIFKIHFIDTGVPHAVHFLDDEKDIDEYPVREIGRKIRYHKTFQPDGTNANFVKVISEDRIKLRTYERGVEDETLACGTGAVASAIISHLVNGTMAPVSVLTKSGDALNIYFKSAKKIFFDVYLEGPAKIVYEGGINYV